MFGMVAHGLITGMLFFIAGSAKGRYHASRSSGWAACWSRRPSSAGSSVCAPWRRWASAWPASGSSPPSCRPTAGRGLNITLFRGLMIAAALGTVLAARLPAVAVPAHRRSASRRGSSPTTRKSTTVTTPTDLPGRRCWSSSRGRPAPSSTTSGSTGSSGPVLRHRVGG